MLELKQEGRDWDAEPILPGMQYGRSREFRAIVESEVNGSRIEHTLPAAERPRQLSGPGRIEVSEADEHLLVNPATFDVPSIYQLEAGHGLARRTDDLAGDAIQAARGAAHVFICSHSRRERSTDYLASGPEHQLRPRSTRCAMKEVGARGRHPHSRRGGNPRTQISPSLKVCAERFADDRGDGLLIALRALRKRATELRIEADGLDAGWA
jgi:hypothetical protein